MQAAYLGSSGTSFRGVSKIGKERELIKGIYQVSCHTGPWVWDTLNSCLLVIPPSPFTVQEQHIVIGHLLARPRLIPVSCDIMLHSVRIKGRCGETFDPLLIFS